MMKMLTEYQPEQIERISKIGGAHAQMYEPKYRAARRLTETSTQKEIFNQYFLYSVRVPVREVLNMNQVRRSELVPFADSSQDENDIRSLTEGRVRKQVMPLKAAFSPKIGALSAMMPEPGAYKQNDGTYRRLLQGILARKRDVDPQMSDHRFLQDHSTRAEMVQLVKAYAGKWYTLDGLGR
jgi:hypothetical protein